MCSQVQRCVLWLTVLLGSASAGYGQVQTLGTYYRGDVDFPEHYRFWHEDANEEGIEDKPATRPASDARLGGSLHVFLRNTGRKSLAITDAKLDGMSLNDSIAFSSQRKVKKFAHILFAGLPKEKLDRLVAAGEPVWWKADPPQVAPGGTAEVTIRLRQTPKARDLKVQVTTDLNSLDVQVPITAAAPRFAGISFADHLKEVTCYLRQPGDKLIAPTRLLMDGVEITSQATIATDKHVDVIPVVIKLARPLARMSFHAFQAQFADGSVAWAGARAWTDDFAYGMFGGLPGNDNPSVGRQYVDDLLGHNINIQMPQVGSSGVSKFFQSAEGQKYMAGHDFSIVLSDPGKWGISRPYALYVHDEPDCGDYKAEGLPDNKKIGGMARWVIDRGQEFIAAAPSVPRMLNLDMTYKPTNWQTYGQIPDILAADPYYQARLRTAYFKKPERIGLYSKATYIYAVGAVAESACEPKPLHLILNSIKHVDKKENRVFRFATPQEKRIEVYYAVAAGAKGLSYWWYTPGAPAFGVGAALTKKDPDAKALFREIGLLGAEMRTAGPLLMESCPAKVKIETSSKLWARSLLVGQNTLVLLFVNDDYRNDDKGTNYTRVQGASATVGIPAWLKNPQLFEITAAGLRDFKADKTFDGLKLPLGDFDLTRMIVVTSDTKLRSRLQAYYTSKLAGPTGQLLSEGGASR